MPCNILSLLVVSLSELDNNQNKYLNATFSNFGANNDQASRSGSPTVLKVLTFPGRNKLILSLLTSEANLGHCRAATRFSTCAGGGSWRSRGRSRSFSGRGGVHLRRTSISLYCASSCRLRQPFQCCTISLWVNSCFQAGFWRERSCTFEETRFVLFCC